MVKEELQREKIRGRAGRGAWSFENRLEKGRGNKWARMCWEEMRGRWNRGITRRGWEEKRRAFFEERRLKIEEVEGRSQTREGWFEEMERGDGERQRRERGKRMRESRYNRWYGDVKRKGVPGYLKKGWRESRWRRVVRYRIGNEVRESKYWEEQRDKECRLCGMERET